MLSSRQVAAIALSLAAVTTGCGGTGADEELAPETSEARGGGPSDVAGYEIAFMKGMIDHHLMGVEMARPCIPGAVHPELRALCEGIVETQLAEIGDMRGWLSAWYGVTCEPGSCGGTGMGMMMPTPDLASLAGGELEIAFMRAMIPHHMQAVMQARGCLSRAQSAPLLELCDGIVTAQSAEIAQMRGWLCEWYGQCGGGMGGGMGGTGGMDGGVGRPAGPVPMGGRGGR